MTIAQFNKKLQEHYRAQGRHALPWRHTKDSYAILVSEIMLQQTQVSRVEGYYGRFLARFPDFAALAKAKTADVLAAWQGLGYNRRALALKKIAEAVIEQHEGALPRSREMLEALPGIGKGTSGSLMAFAFNKPEIFIETNVRRVFIHEFFPRAAEVTDAEIERYIERAIDKKHPREWYWALMDYGTWLARPSSRSRQPANPNRKSAHYRKQSAFKGSDREIRGKVLRYLLAPGAYKKRVRAQEVQALLGAPRERFGKVIAELQREGFIAIKGEYIRINQ